MKFAQKLVWRGIYTKSNLRQRSKTKPEAMNSRNVGSLHVACQILKTFTGQSMRNQRIDSKLFLAMHLHIDINSAYATITKSFKIH